MRGCGGLPPGGCQLWSVNLTQATENPVNTSRLIGLANNYWRELCGYTHAVVV